MKLLILVALLSISFGYKFDDELTFKDLKKANLRLLFDDWKVAFNKEYKNIVQETHRFKIWVHSMKRIAKINSANLTYKAKMNQFGDLTKDEFKIAIHGHSGSCLRPPKDLKHKKLAKAIESSNNIDAPTSVDWEAKGDVTPVKNQGQCGSCWAFASTGCIECNYAIKNGKLNSLSEQQLVDCTQSYGNYGCNGGWWYNAFDYVIKEGGLCTEQEYPYTARDGTCKDKTCGTKYDPISQSVKVTPDNGQDLMNAVANGCVAVGVEADQSAFQFYSSGVLTGTCGTRIDHGVLVVGYGSMNGQDYWKVKNSWGTTWGDKGYLYICRDCNKNGNEGECGINMYPYMVAAQ